MLESFPEPEPIPAPEPEAAEAEVAAGADVLPLPPPASTARVEDVWVFLGLVAEPGVALAFVFASSLDAPVLDSVAPVARWSPVLSMPVLVPVLVLAPAPAPEPAPEPEPEPVPPFRRACSCSLDA